MNQPIYICRRCEIPTEHYSYNSLRAHLRAVHHIQRLANSDLPLYAVYPGDQNVQDFNSPGTGFDSVEQDPSVEAIYYLRDELVRAVANSVANNVRNIHVTASPVNFDIQEMLSAFHEMRENITHTIGANIKIGIKNAIKELSEQLDNSVENRSSGPNQPVQGDASDFSLAPTPVTQNPRVNGSNVNPSIGQNQSSNSNTPSEVVDHAITTTSAAVNTVEVHNPDSKNPYHVEKPASKSAVPNPVNNKTVLVRIHCP